jgi:hypothetical protein
LAAAAVEWKRLVGPEFDPVRPLLRPGRERATSYPSPDGGLPYEVVEHGPDEWVGVCPETRATVPLSAQDLIVYELDRPRLADRIAAAFGIERASSASDLGHGIIDLGRCSVRDQQYSCFLAFPLEPDDLHVAAARLITAGLAPLLLFAPTRRRLARVAESQLRVRRSAFVSLAETLTAFGPGGFRAAEPLAAIVARETAQPAAAVGRPNANVFRRDGEFWTLGFADQTVRVKSSLGLQYIAHLLGAKGRSVDATALWSAVRGRVRVKPSAGTEILDARAFQEYEAEVEDLAEQLREAKEFNDLAKQELLQGRLGSLVEQLEAARGLGGRTRAVKDEAANLRTSIKNAITRALENQICTHHPALARHLDTIIHTGQSLGYAPDPDVVWEL